MAGSISPSECAADGMAGPPLAVFDVLPEHAGSRLPRVFIAGDANNILYQFSVSHADRCLLAGRAAVVLDASALNKEQP